MFAIGQAAERESAGGGRGAGVGGGAGMKLEEGEGVGISGTESQYGCMTNGQDKTSLTSPKNYSFAIWEDSSLA